MKAAIYCRVSTDDQEKEGTSLQTQREACLAYCKQKGYPVVRQFSETFSGLTIERPKLAELRDLVNRNEIDVIVVYCLDRLSRDPSHGAMLFQQFEDHNIRLEAVTETIENTDLGKLISYIRGFASKLEADKIRERTMRGKLAYVKQGKLPTGTGIGIYGYQWDKTTGKRTIIEHEAQTVQKIFTMVIQGASFNKIAIEFNNQGIKSKSGSLWYPLTIRRIVSNPTYTGKTYYGMSKRVGKNKVIAQPRENWTLLPDVTPPIITQELFNQAQEAIKLSRQSRPVKPNAHYFLTSFARCSKCGSPLIGTTLNRKYRYYRCSGSRPTATRGKICDAGYIKADNLEDSIFQHVLQMLTNPLSLLQTLSSNTKNQPDVALQLDKQIDTQRKKLKTYPRKEKSFYELLAHDAVTKDYVLDAITHLRQDQLNDQQRLQSLLQIRSQSNPRHTTLKLTDLAKGALALISYYITGNPETEQHDYIPRIRSVYSAINLKVLADPTSYQFNFTLDGTIVSSTDSHELSSLEHQLEDFERNHPDVTLKDLLDETKLLPGDTPFVQKVNQLKKNLVTIERTWAL